MVGTHNFLRATAAHGAMVAYVIDSTEAIKKMQDIHQTSPVVSAALGRLTTAAMLMGGQLKNEAHTVTLQTKTDGLLSYMVAISNGNGEVKSFANHTILLLPENSKGKLDVSGAVGAGDLIVIKDMGLKEPYTSQTPLISGEIAEDITYYYALSEQIPSVVALGVLVDTRDFSIIHAGGFMVQLLPFATDDIIDTLEALIENIDPVTTMLENNMTSEDILHLLLDPFHIDGGITSASISYACDCNRERMEKALISLGEKEIRALLTEDKKAELSCQFCNTTHLFTDGDLHDILKHI